MSDRTMNASRPRLKNAYLRYLSVGVIGFITVYFIAVFPYLPEALRQAGSPVLYVIGVIGAILLCVPMVYVSVKRSGGGDEAPKYYVAHVVAAYVGIILVAIHGAGNLSRPPALMYLALFGLVLSGMWARLVLARRMSATFAEKHKSFAKRVEGDDRTRLSQIIMEKEQLLVAIDTAATEATFSLEPRHWKRHPLLAWRYSRLVTEEQKILGVRQAIPAAQAYWWFAHRLLAFGFVAGIVIHVITVTFFAGYVADGGEITWWHITDW